jgi:phage shock protein C
MGTQSRRAAPWSSLSHAKLYRSQTDRKLAGVCGGLGEYFNVDMTLVRILSVVLAVCGAGLVLYLAMWILIPEPSKPGSTEEFGGLSAS